MEDQQINEISGININLSMITVNINGFNFSIKRHKLVDWNRKQDLTYKIDFKSNLVKVV